MRARPASRLTPPLRSLRALEPVKNHDFSRGAWGNEGAEALRVRQQELVGLCIQKIDVRGFVIVALHPRRFARPARTEEEAALFCGEMDQSGEHHASLRHKLARSPPTCGALLGREAWIGHQSQEVGEVLGGHQALEQLGGEFVLAVLERVDADLGGDSAQLGAQDLPHQG